MTKKMTIGYILDDTLDKPDGVQQAMLSIGETMRARGHDVHYLVPYTERIDIQNIHSLARVISLRFNGNVVRTPIWSSTKKIKKIIDDTQFDVLHVQAPYSPLFAGRILNASNKRTVVALTFHILPYNWFANFGTKILRTIVRRTNKRVNHPYAVSEPSASFMHRSFGLQGSVLPNPVDYAFFSSYATKKQISKKMKIVFVGRFVRRKGVMQLLRAFTILHDRGNIELIMCGKGPLLDEAKSYASSHNLNVIFTGFVTEEEKANYLSNADIAVFPSTSGESFGIVLAEAMAAGSTVVLGGNNPGYASVLHSWPEVLFDPNDSSKFAAKLQQFIDDEKLRTTIGKQQQEYVKQFDVQKICDQLERDYCTTSVKEAY